MQFCVLFAAPRCRVGRKWKMKNERYDTLIHPCIARRAHYHSKPIYPKMFQTFTSLPHKRVARSRDMAATVDIRRRYVRPAKYMREEYHIRSEILLTTIFISAFVCMCVSVCYHRCLLYPRSENKRRENEKTALFSRCFAEYLINTVGIVRLYSGSMRFGWRVFLFLLFFSVKILYFRSLCASKSAPSFHSPPVHSTHNWDWGDDKAKVRIQIKSICYGIFLLTSVVPFDVCVMLNASILSCVLCTVWLRGCVCAVCIAFIADNVM